MVDLGPLHRVRQLVSEHLTDDDLCWLNDQLTRVDLPPVLIRGGRDIPAPPPPGGYLTVNEARELGGLR